MKFSISFGHNLPTILVVWLCLCLCGASEIQAQQQKTIPTQSLPQTLVTTAVENRVYLIERGSATITVIDSDADRIITRIPLPAEALAITVTKEHQLAVSTKQPGIHMIDARSNRLISSISLDYELHTLWNSPQSDLIFGLNNSAGKLIALSRDSLNILFETEVSGIVSELSAVASKNKIYLIRPGRTGIDIFTIEGNSKMVESSQPNLTGPEILVRFQSEADEAQITAAAAELKLEQVKVIKALNIRVFRIPSGASPEDIVAAFGKLDFVEYAEISQTYKKQQ